MLFLWILIVWLQRFETSEKFVRTLQKLKILDSLQSEVRSGRQMLATRCVRSDLAHLTFDGKSRRGREQRLGWRFGVWGTDPRSVKRNGKDDEAALIK